MFVEYTVVFLFADYFYHDGRFADNKNILDCAILCVDTLGCSSFFYSSNLTSCMISSTRYMNTAELTNQVGYRYYKMPPGFGSKCVTKADCRYQNSLCTDAICECEVGFSYDSHNESCVKKCTKYGDKYATYRRRSIKGNNAKTIRVSNYEGCIQACVKETSFVCTNAEYHRFSSSANCNLCKESWFDLPAEYLEKDMEEWVLLLRHCAS